MGGGRRWVAVIVAAVLAIGVLGIVATQVPLSRAKEEPCGTALRLDQRQPTIWRHSADQEDTTGGDLAAELRARDLHRQADAYDRRCKRRQALALGALGGAAALAVATIAVSSYNLGRQRPPRPRGV